jgi:hypothetical protein
LAALAPSEFSSAKQERVHLEFLKVEQQIQETLERRNGDNVNWQQELDGLWKICHSSVQFGYTIIF